MNSSRIICQDTWMSLSDLLILYIYLYIYIHFKTLFHRIKEEVV